MFEYICGKLSVKKIDYVALDINGLAYKIYISLKTFEKMSNIESTEKLYIHTNVKEDNISLYGFKTQNERELFKALISVNGVGPKLAIAILSTFNTKEIVDIILENEPKIFIKVPGLGIKKAQKIILDLKDKVGMAISKPDDVNNISLASDEALEALIALGFNLNDATKALEQIPRDLSTEERITLALKAGI